jgi:hypothetical protein
MSRATIYARHSTEEHQFESIDTQLDNASRFRATHGWSVVAEAPRPRRCGNEHCYEHDGETCAAGYMDASKCPHRRAVSADPATYQVVHVAPVSTPVPTTPAASAGEPVLSSRRMSVESPRQKIPSL